MEKNFELDDVIEPSVNVITSKTKFFKNFGDNLSSCKNHCSCASGFRDR